MSHNPLKNWVSDRLLSLLGFSQPTLVEYTIGLAKQAASPADVLSKLEGYGLSLSSTDVRLFAEEIFGKVPRNQKKEREAAIYARKEETCAILDADYDEDVTVTGSKKADKRKKRFRKKIDSEQDEDDEEIRHVEEKRRVKRRTSQDKDDDSTSDSGEERLRDQREMEDLERNIRGFEKEGAEEVRGAQGRYRR